MANKRSAADITGKSAAAKVATTLTLAASDDRPLVVSINIYVARQDRHRLNQLALDENTSVQKLVREGIDAMLQARGLMPLEPATANTPSGLRRGR